jgi:glutamate synthase (NADPH/NADH) small chain
LINAPTYLMLDKGTGTGLDKGLNQTAWGTHKGARIAMRKKQLSPTHERDMDIERAFSDLHPPLDAGAAFIEASRCLYCYDAPCINACPTAIDIPTFIHQIRTDNLDGSARTILDANIMGGTCARACPTEILCEGACVLNKGDEKPIRIGALQRRSVDHLMDKVAKNGIHPFERAPQSGRKLAVIGAGPAGLSFAHRAAMLGHDITVYEARPKPGGLNEYGLAAYKMVDDFAQKEIDFLLGIGGIGIKYGKKLGEDFSLSDLKKQYDGIFIGIGLGGSGTLGIPGEDLDGVEPALSFIEQLRQAKQKSRIKCGRDVVVIGGGNTAIDAAIQSKKLGAETVTLVYRRGEDSMSATAWERNLARLNDVQIRTWARPSSIGGDQKADHIMFERTKIIDGRLQGTGETFRLAADLILKAIGQKMLPLGLGDLQIKNGRIVVDEQFQTSMPGIYAGGDCIQSGDDLTVQAVQDGKLAALAIDQALTGNDAQPPVAAHSGKGGA